jgi:hypothetical protein
MTRNGWKAILLAAPFAWIAVVTLVLWLSETTEPWLMALLVSVPFVIVVRVALRRLQAPPPGGHR